MSNSEPSHMEHEIQQDHSRVLEQQIFTRGVLGYCTHFDIPDKNYYNINFPHFQDFESLYHQEKFLKQNLKSALMNSNPEFPYLSELDKALENILIAKNNYQRIMLQMLDTIYYQEQRSKQQSVFLEVHNTVTSQKDTYIDQLKNALSYLAGNSQTISQSPATHNSINDKTSRKETSKTPRNTSERKKTPTQTLSNYSSQRSLALKQRDLNIDLGGYMSKQMKKTGTPCVSYRAKSPQVGANTQKTHQTPRTKSISSSRHNSISTLKSGREEMSKEVNKKASYFSRRGSETTYSARLEESSNGKEKRRMSLKGNKSVSKEIAQGNGVKRERNMTWNMAENGIEDMGEKRLVSISSIQEDCNDHEYDSFKINRTKTAPNNERTEMTESSGYYHYKEDGYRVPYNKQERLGSEYLATTQNKSISFQSSTGNLFQETENIRGDDGVLREVGSHRENCVWPRETINTERDQVYGEKPWDLMEGNIVTSPSFGMQTAYTERSFSQKLGENKNRGKLERHEKKQGENVMVGKFYGQSSVAKKKTWTPLLSKKY